MGWIPTGFSSGNKVWMCIGWFAKATLVDSYRLPAIQHRLVWVLCLLLGGCIAINCDVVKHFDFAYAYLY